MTLINNLVTLIRYVRLFNLLQNNQKFINTVNLIFLPSYTCFNYMAYQTKVKNFE